MTQIKINIIKFQNNFESKIRKKHDGEATVADERGFRTACIKGGKLYMAG